MTRRALVLLAVLPRKIPTNGDSLNKFAEAYNEFVKELTAGKINIKLWERAEEAWKKIF